MSMERLENLMRANGNALPQYETTMVGKQRHGDYLFKSIVTLYDGAKFSSDLCSNEVDAERNAADNALHALFGFIGSFPTKPEDSKNVDHNKELAELVSRFLEFDGEKQKIVLKIVRSLVE
jgi:hypothetical protein